MNLLKISDVAEERSIRFWRRSNHNPDPGIFTAFFTYHRVSTVVARTAVI